MDPIELQSVLKNNNKDLSDFCDDLRRWGDEMKRKTYPQTSSKPAKEKCVKIASKPVEKVEISKKVKAPMSYTDWEKYDAEKECEKLDKVERDSSNEEDEEINEKLKERALIEKENGNKFVKLKNWEKAIECYTRAIDCHPYDSVFYANRALCYLKTEQFSKAEEDCTISLKIDNSYVKAYQRRAAARESQKKYRLAFEDCKRVLQFEPKNSETLKSLEFLKSQLITIEKEEKNVENSNCRRPVSVFTASRKKADKNEKSDGIYWPSGEQKSIVHPIGKPPHLRSKKPRKVVEIVEVNSMNPIKKGHISSTDNLKIIERKQPEEVGENAVENVEIVKPKTSVQFYATWKRLGKIEKFKYLNLSISPSEVPELFQESLEIGLFSEILYTLSEFSEKFSMKLYDFLFNFGKVKRFSTLTMFFTSTEKNYFKKIINYIQKKSLKNELEINELYNLYEISH